MAAVSANYRTEDDKDVEKNLTKVEIDFYDKREKKEGFVMMEWGQDKQLYEMYQFPIMRLFDPTLNDVSSEIDNQIVELYN